jgi:hypothetical protein
VPTDTQAGNDTATIKRLVEQAVRAAVAPDDISERPIFPGASSTWAVPDPMAGFSAARIVARLAEQEVHKYAVQLRGEGKSWRELADLMDIGWSDEYSRPERAFELVAGPDNSESVWSRGPTVFWYCAGPRGCGQHVTDRGPYNGHPHDNEDGHADHCLRLIAEAEAYERESEERDRHGAAMDEAYGKLPENSFARSTADRARYVEAHGGRYLGWSTSESLAVALVLNDLDALARNGYPKRADALQRVVGGMSNPPRDPESWLALIRTAATGRT